MLSTLVNFSYNLLTFTPISAVSLTETRTTVMQDPLEQFEVLSSPFFGTNLGFILFLNLFLLSFLLAYFRPTITNNYDFALRSLYNLVRSMVRENLSIKKQQYFSILFYLFVTILLANLVGLVPYSFTVTSSFVVTFFLALGHFLGINLIGVNSHRWELANLFLPSGAPLPIAPFLVFIEKVSYLARVFSLSIRLFANMMSGHALLKILIGFSWNMLTSASILVSLAILPWLVVTAISFLELLIAFLQAYVFVILVTIYINDVLNLH